MEGKEVLELLFDENVEFTKDQLLRPVGTNVSIFGKSLQHGCHFQISQNWLKLAE